MALRGEARERRLAPPSRAGMAKIGIDSSSPMASAAIIFITKFGVSTAPAKANFGVPVGVEDAPIGSDAAFIGLPRLVEGFDDRIVDAHGIGPGDEVAHDLAPG